MCAHHVCVWASLLTFLCFLRTPTYTWQRARTNFPHPIAGAVTKQSCHVTRKNAVQTLVRLWATSSTFVSAANTVKGACCPNDISASLSVIYPDFYKWWPPTPQCAFNLGVQFENLFKLVCQGGTADCFLYRTHVGRCNTTCAKSKAEKQTSNSTRLVSSKERRAGKANNLKTESWSAVILKKPNRRDEMKE